MQETLKLEKGPLEGLAAPLVVMLVAFSERTVDITPEVKQQFFAALSQVFPEKVPGPENAEDSNYGPKMTEHLFDYGMPEFRKSLINATCDRDGRLIADRLAAVAGGTPEAVQHAKRARDAMRRIDYAAATPELQWFSAVILAPMLERGES